MTYLEKVLLIWAVGSVVLAIGIGRVLAEPVDELDELQRHYIIGLRGPHPTSKEL